MTTFPTLDPELAAALTMLPKVDFADLPNARATYDALVGTMLADLSFDGVTLRELSAPGLDGDPEVTIRFFTPDNTAGPVPVLLWIHGGGFAIGTAESSDPFCVEVARELGFAVANVEYRLAPETPFPGPSTTATPHSSTSTPMPRSWGSIHAASQWEGRAQAVDWPQALSSKPVTRALCPWPSNSSKSLNSTTAWRRSR
ncbi:hypothetical protein RQN9TF_29010 [Rhodococcus qingshengii]|nr:hypothetical protein RQN9TF_29010 [Rhodococcus qingshengii]